MKASLYIKEFYSFTSKTIPSLKKSKGEAFLTSLKLNEEISSLNKSYTLLLKVVTEIKSSLVIITTVFWLKKEVIKKAIKRSETIKLLNLISIFKFISIEEAK
jgi:hypothetical protein